MIFRELFTEYSFFQNANIVESTRRAHTVASTITLELSAVTCLIGNIPERKGSPSPGPEAHLF